MWQRKQVRKTSRVSGAPNALTTCQRVRRESDHILHNSPFHYLGNRIPRIADITDETTCAAIGGALASDDSRYNYRRPFGWLRPGAGTLAFFGPAFAGLSPQPSPAISH